MVCGEAGVSYAKLFFFYSPRYSLESPQSVTADRLNVLIMHMTHVTNSGLKKSISIEMVESESVEILLPGAVLRHYNNSRTGIRFQETNTLREFNRLD